MLEEDRDGIKWNEFVQDFYDIRNEAPFFFWKILIENILSFGFHRAPFFISLIYRYLNVFVTGKKKPIFLIISIYIKEIDKNVSRAVFINIILIK